VLRGVDGCADALSLVVAMKTSLRGPGLGVLRSTAGAVCCLILTLSHTYIRLSKIYNRYLTKYFILVAKASEHRRLT